jgi:hypothetical protein
MKGDCPELRCKLATLDPYRLGDGGPFAIGLLVTAANMQRVICAIEASIFECSPGHSSGARTRRPRLGNVG